MKIMGRIILTAVLSIFMFSGHAFCDKHWQARTTDKFDSIYGKIIGDLTLKPGDEIAVFDKSGNCYGTGIYNGELFFVSVFGMDKGDKAEGDFPIPAFNIGDEVLFKAYSVSEGREYDLRTASGQPYLFASKGIYPPQEVNLTYTAPAVQPPDDGDDDGGNDGQYDEDTGTDTSDNNIVGGGIPGIIIDTGNGSTDSGETGSSTGGESTGQSQKVYADTGAGNTRQYQEGSTYPDYQGGYSSYPQGSNAGKKLGTDAVKHPEQISDQIKTAKAPGDSKHHDKEGYGKGKKSKFLAFLKFLFLLLTISAIAFGVKKIMYRYLSK